jgi:hypothetical protein
VDTVVTALISIKALNFTEARDILGDKYPMSDLLSTLNTHFVPVNIMQQDPD